MSPRRDRLLVCSAMLAACLVVLGLGAVDHAGAMHLLPLLALLVPLLLGRYPGERLLARLAGARPPRRRKPVRQSRPRSRRAHMPRRVVAWSLACRPPPALRFSA